MPQSSPVEGWREMVCRKYCKHEIDCESDKHPNCKRDCPLNESIAAELARAREEERAKAHEQYKPLVILLKSKKCLSDCDDCPIDAEKSICMDAMIKSALAKIDKDNK